MLPVPSKTVESKGERDFAPRFTMSTMVPTERAKTTRRPTATKKNRYYEYVQFVVERRGARTRSRQPCVLFALDLNGVVHWPPCVLLEQSMCVVGRDKDSPVSPPWEEPWLTCTTLVQCVLKLRKRLAVVRVYLRGSARSLGFNILTLTLTLTLQGHATGRGCCPVLVDPFCVAHCAVLARCFAVAPLPYAPRSERSNDARCSWRRPSCASMPPPTVCPKKRFEPTAANEYCKQCA
jgi:hypothetical protein